MNHTKDHIIKELEIKDEVINIFPYGSRVYGNHGENSDHDYVIVCKPSILSNGAFKNNAISNKDFSIQGIVYSRSGFKDALNNYDITALECIFLEDSRIIFSKWDFSLDKIDERALSRSIISKSSMSLHSSKNFKRRGNIKKAKVGVYHSIRILDFGLQIKEFGKIVNYGSCNDLKESIMGEQDFRIGNYRQKFEELSTRIKK